MIGWARLDIGNEVETAREFPLCGTTLLVFGCFQPPSQHCVPNNIDAASHIELLHRIRFVSFNRLDAEVQVRGDFLVGMSPRDHTQHFFIAMSQIRPRRGPGLLVERVALLTSFPAIAGST